MIVRIKSKRASELATGGYEWTGVGLEGEGEEWGRRVGGRERERIQLSIPSLPHI